MQLAIIDYEKIGNSHKRFSKNLQKRPANRESRDRVARISSRELQRRRAKGEHRASRPPVAVGGGRSTWEREGGEPAAALSRDVPRLPRGLAWITCNAQAPRPSRRFLSAPRSLRYIHTRALGRAAGVGRSENSLGACSFRGMLRYPAYFLVSLQN